MTDKKRLDRERQIDPRRSRLRRRRAERVCAEHTIENVLQARTPEGAQLGPYPADDLVATPAPRPSLSGIVAELEGEGAGRLRALAVGESRGGAGSARDGRRPQAGAYGEPPAVARKAQQRRSDYVELHARSAFSFLRSASLPEDLADAAADAGHEIFGVADLGGVYGAPRFHGAARRTGIRPLVGAEIEIEDAGLVTLLCENRQGYKNLCRLLTLGHADREKGECHATLAQLADLRHGLVALSAGNTKELCALASTLGNDNLFAEVLRHLDPGEERENRRRIDAAHARGLRIVAGGGVSHATPHLKPLFDALTCIRLKTTLDEAGRKLSRNAERHVRPPAEMEEIFRDLPEAVRSTREIAERCAFTLEDLGYEFPDPHLTFATTLDGELRHRTFEGARSRYGGPQSARWPAAAAQIERELSLIAKLGLAGYFLIVHDLVRFCAEEKILVQGRGSAANSAVCFALGITAVDPVGMGLLFERFLSEERTDSTGHKAWPDIDLDLPSGDQREKAIQHVYKRFGAQGAAMTANVITYRARSAAREIGKVLGLPQGELDRLSKLLPHFEFTSEHDDLPNRAREAGFAVDDRRVKLFLTLCRQIAGLPRHLGQHSGGMIVARTRLDEIVPLEPASMPGRVVVQWDKDDCADLGIIKVDLLGLGMMSVLEQAVPMIRAHEGVEIDLAKLPEGDPKVYEMLQKADTVGVFQVESRAQMATLPRMRPSRFYDIVVEVAIIRPGPIVGQMVNPYLERRAGRQEVTVPHPSLWPVLERTLGVPLFQEQLMRIAMVAADFTGGEADELRRAMGSKRSLDRMKRIEERLRAGMTKNGIAPKAQDEIVQGITSFALYGFPESHAASFALLVYASAYLKAHHPQAFTAAMLNCWPMGFYSPATLVKDAQRRGVHVRPIDVLRSDWLCTLERDGPEEDLQLRLGMRYARGLRQAMGEAMVRERSNGGPFRSISDLAARVPLRRDELATLAEIGALGSLDVRTGGPRSTRRSALWQAEAAVQRGPGLFARVEPRDEGDSPLPEMTLRERTAADLRGTGIAVGPHPVALERDKLRALRVRTASELIHLRGGRRVRAGGLCIVRQRPGTAKGFVFLSLEDETGISNIVIDPDTFEQNRRPILTAALLVVEGRLEQYDGVTSVKGDRFWSLSDAVEGMQSRDFH
jgi:error-prone DNA polymerase